MKIQNLENTLIEHPFFSSLSREDIKALGDCASLKVFHRDDLLIEENEPADFFFIIRAGRVSLDLNTSTHQSLSLQILEKGDILGWSWIIPPYHYDFNAKALELTRVIALMLKSYEISAKKIHP